MSTEFNPNALDGFTEHLFLVLGRFRDVAVNNHIDGGNLADATYHETALVSGDALLNQYEPPVVFTVFSGYEGDADTVRKQTDTLSMDAAVFDWNFSREFGLENVIRLVANVVDNVEQNRTLESRPGVGDPVAEDVTWSSLEPDFEFSDNQDMVLHWCSVSFEVQTRRLRPA